MRTIGFGSLTALDLRSMPLAIDSTQKRQQVERNLRDSGDLSNEGRAGVIAVAVNVAQSQEIHL